MPSIQPSLWKHPFTYIDKNKNPHEISTNEKIFIIALTALAGALTGPFAIFIFYGIAKHLRDRKISFDAGDKGKPAKATKIWNAAHKNLAKDKNNEVYSQRIEDFKKFCDEKKIDVIQRRKTFYQFFTDENFIKSSQVDQHFDFGIEDVCGVFYIHPANERDKEFLNYLYAKYPQELKVIHQSDETKGYLTLAEDTRFANNDTFKFISMYHDQPKVLIMLKDLLLYCILRDRVCNERNFAR